MSEHIVWDVSPEIFLLFGNYGPRWYGLCFALTICLGYLVMRRFFIAAGRSEEELHSLVTTFVVGTIAGARLGHCLFYEPTYYLSRPWEILFIWQGGLASHGGTIGVFIAMVYFTRKHHVPFMWLADRLAIAIALGVPFIRIGNFFNSEIIGRPSNLPWAIVFKNVDDVPRHPAQLYEAASYFVLFLVLSAYYRVTKGNFPSGRLIGLMFIWIFGSRILIEFVKENQEAFENDMILNMGQLLSIPMVLLGIFFFFGLQRKLKSTSTGKT